jgi:hypothetical protein
MTSRQRMKRSFTALIVALAVSLIAKPACPFPSDSFFRGRRRGLARSDCLGTTASHRETIVTHVGAGSPNRKDGTQSFSLLERHYLHYESRRSLINRSLTLVAVVGSLSSARPSAARAASSAGVTVQRAVGSGEAKCRTQGNCLEVGELDGAVGWSWGGKDRCDPRDVNCGADGRVRSSPLVGQPVPDADAAAANAAASITHVAAIQLDVGRDETGVLRIGLYGNDCPGSVQETVDFLSSGLSTLRNENAIGALTRPVSLAVGGGVSNIVPALTVALGVPSQTVAYGRSRGLSKTTGFVPQPRPDPGLTASDGTVRKHDAAGLVSVPKRGIGYGGSGFEGDDEAYESAILVTAAAAPALDSSHRVIGQILDPESMSFLERLATLPTKKGIKGVIPGQSSGPPLLKVVVKQVVVSPVEGRPTS